MNKKKQIEIEDLILEILYVNRDFNFTHDGLITEARKKIHDKDFESDDFTNAIMRLWKEKFIDSREAVIPLPKGVSEEDWTGEQEIIEIYYLTEKGMNRVINTNMKKRDIKLSEHEKFLQELAIGVEKQSRDVIFTKQDIDQIKKEVKHTKKEISLLKTNIDKKLDDVVEEVDRIKKEFYGRILLIFSIFVSVFAFIIVGFTQITTLVNPESDWIINFSNVSAVFFPLLIVLLILIIATFFIIKATSK